MLSSLFPPKCVLCRKLLTHSETDLCHDCRKNAPEFLRAKRNIPFVAHWTAIWYYKDNVRSSIHRFKFYNARNYADVYARLLAIKIQNEPDGAFDVISWVPVSPLRRFTRGYDQSQLVANALSRELGVSSIKVLKKIHHTPPQSSLKDAAQRKANVLGVYKVCAAEKVIGKRILLIDDVVTTGATASECACTLLAAGAKEVVLAAIAAASNDKNK